MIVRLRAIEPRQRVSSEKMRELTRLKKEFGRKLYMLHDGASAYIRGMLESIVAAMLDDADVSALSGSLQNLAVNIAAIGTDVVLFDQVTSYFMFLFPKPSVQLDAEELETELNNLCEIVNLRQDAWPAARDGSNRRAAAAR